MNFADCGRSSDDDTAGNHPWFIRGFRQGDEVAWLELVKAAPDFPYVIFNQSPSLDALRMTVEHPSMDAAHNLWFAEFEGHLIGYAELWHDEGRPRKVFKLLVHPDWRQKGLGTELLKLIEQRARCLGGARLDVMVEETQSGGRAFLHIRGLSEVHRCWEMALPADAHVPLPRWPSAYSHRNFVAGHDESISVKLENASFGDEWEYVPVQVGEVVGFVRSPSFRAQGVTYAVSGGEVVGECWAWIEDQPPRADSRGDIWCLCVHPAHRGRGLGRALLLSGVQWLREQGVGLVKLGVDGANDRAKHLYESVGFRQHRTDLWYREEL